MVPGEEHPHHSAAPPRDFQRGRRHKVQGDDRLFRLETEPSYLNEDQLDHGSVQVDLFASRLTTQCRHYFSWQPDPYAKPTDAFLQDWSQVRGYANPCTMESGGESSGTCPVPASPSGAGGPSLEDAILVSSVTINTSSMPPSDQPGSRGHSSPNPATQLAVWNISGRDTESRSFRRTQLRSGSGSGSSLGEPGPTGLTTHCSQGGITGVVNGTKIPFRVL